MKATDLWHVVARKQIYGATACEKCERLAKHQTRVDAFRLDAFTLPGSPLDDNTVERFPLSVNNPA